MNTTGLYKLFGSISFAFLANLMSPIWFYLYIPFLLILLDIVVGVSAAILGRNEEMDPTKFRKTINKVVQYVVGILAAWILAHIIADLTITEPEIKIVQAAFGYMIASELISIYTHISHSTGLPLLETMKKFIPGMTPTKELNEAEEEINKTDIEE